jgi:hypothetical protein
MDEPRLLLSLTVPPNLEEAIIDWLLSSESRSGFSSFPVNGHSSEARGLTLAEQVSGRKRNIRFEICRPKPEVDTLLEKLRQDFPKTGISYWVTPAENFGHV